MKHQQQTILNIFQWENDIKYNVHCDIAEQISINHSIN